MKRRLFFALCSGLLVAPLSVFAQAFRDEPTMEANDVLVAATGDFAGDLVGIGGTVDPQPVADSAPQRVDILVAYTPAARAYAGSTAAMKAAINTYISATNTAYTNSDINVVMKLVGAVEVAYTEHADMATDLARLRSTTDNFLTTVPGLRDTYRADLVALIRRNGAAGVAGIGYLGSLTSGFASSAYSVSADVWAVSNNTFPHETGHNFGCHHDHANGSGAARVYAYGHRFNGTNNVQYRTIMAYSPGSRISYFSNPSINYQGRATGVGGTNASTAADNARLIEESAVVTRAFRNGGLRLGGTVAGDINNDGSADLMLSDAATGERYAWLMSGTTRSSEAGLGTVPTAWRLAASADFNADNKADLIWENTSTGARSVWFMNGVVASSTAALPTVAVAWRIAGVGDFNADNKADLVWENTSTGARSVWYMNGVVASSTAALPTVAVAWRIAGVGDFNADNKADLVWENTSTGARSIWCMNGVTVASKAALPTVAVDWRIVGVGDFNDDDKPDLVWEQQSTKSRTLWYMNGVVRSSTATLPGAHFN